MGISLNEGVILSEFARRYSFTGRALSIGVPAIHFTFSDFVRALNHKILKTGQDSLNAAEFLAYLGFDTANFCDISTYEGADLIFDLNDSALPPSMVGRFDAVFDCGSLEHIFNVPVALTNLGRMLKRSGYIYHVTCLNNAVDHGFYQFSPTLFFDYYPEAGFTILEAMSLTFDPKNWASSPWTIRHIRHGTFSKGLLGALSGDKVSLLLCLAKKDRCVPDAVRPFQFIYKEENLQPTLVNPRWFPTYTMQAGTQAPLYNYARLSLDNFCHDDGFCYLAQINDPAMTGNDETDPARSNLLLLEDGQPLGPMSWPHEDIRTQGKGAYNHWKDHVYFSSTDGSDPRSNKKSYEALVETKL